MQYAMCASSVCFGGESPQETKAAPQIPHMVWKPLIATQPPAQSFDLLCPVMGHLYKAPRSGWRNFQPPPNALLPLNPKVHQHNVCLWFLHLRICTFVFKKYFRSKHQVLKWWSLLKDKCDVWALIRNWLAVWSNWQICCFTLHGINHELSNWG